MTWSTNCVGVGVGVGVGAGAGHDHSSSWRCFDSAGFG